MGTLFGDDLDPGGSGKGGGIHMSFYWIIKCADSHSSKLQSLKNWLHIWSFEVRSHFMRFRAVALSYSTLLESWRQFLHWRSVSLRKLASITLVRASAKCAPECTVTWYLLIKYPWWILQEVVCETRNNLEWRYVWLSRRDFCSLWLQGHEIQLYKWEWLLQGEGYYWSSQVSATQSWDLEFMHSTAWSRWVNQVPSRVLRFLLIKY